MGHIKQQWELMVTTTRAYCFSTGRMIRMSSKPIQLHPNSLGGERSCPLSYNKTIKMLKKDDDASPYTPQFHAYYKKYVALVSILLSRLRLHILLVNIQ